jgi:hypothetical protein
MNFVRPTGFSFDILVALSATGDLFFYVFFSFYCALKRIRVIVITGRG